jgi:aerobic carbon-monoxide dehydrogenase large subunit
LLTGGGRFVDDVDLPGLLSLAVLRSPHPHARLRAVDLTDARRLPGVVDALAGGDVAHLAYQPALRGLPELRRPPAPPPLAVDEVRHVGDAVAAVLADSPARARDALDRIAVEYEPLPGVADPEAALGAGAPLVHADHGSNVAYDVAFGSPPAAVAAALRDAGHVVSLRLRSPRVAPVPLEPRTFLASFSTATGELEVWASTQAPFALRGELAGALGLPPERVRVLAEDVGGGFGAKTRLYREDLLAAYLARRHGRPVRWTATRGEDLLTTQQARDQTHAVEAGFSRAGDLLALRVRIITGLGAYLSPSAPLSGIRAGRLMCGLYRVPLARSEVVGVYTTTPPTGVYRGAGRPEAALSIERVLDVAARELGLEPAEIRRRNFVRADELPWTTPLGVTLDSGDYARALDRALSLADYPSLRARRARAHARGELFGVGLCAFVDPSGGAGGETGRVRVDRDGSVTVFAGSFPQGQGHATTFAQIAADRLRVPIDRVRVVQGDTRQVPFGVGTFAARSMPLGGSAVYRAAEGVLDRLRALAADLLEVPEADVVYDAGVFHPAGVPARGLTFAEVAAAAPAHQAPDATRHFDDAREPHAYGCHLAAVSIDRDTGRLRIERYVAVDDAGVLINPLLAEGQLHGGLAQGIGQAVSEEMAFAADGTVLAGSLGDYGLPRAADLPEFVLDRTTSPSPLNPVGAKGIGESGAVGAPAAIASAVLDALAATAGGRARVQPDLPLTAERLWRAAGGPGPAATTSEPARRRPHDRLGTNPGL